MERIGFGDRLKKITRTVPEDTHQLSESSELIKRINNRRKKSLSETTDVDSFLKKTSENEPLDTNHLPEYSNIRIDNRITESPDNRIPLSEEDYLKKSSNLNQVQYDLLKDTHPLPALVDSKPTNEIMARTKESESLLEHQMKENIPSHLSKTTNISSENKTFDTNYRITEYPDNRSDTRITELPNRIDTRITELSDNRSDNRITEYPDNRSDTRIPGYPDNRISLSEGDYLKKPSDLNQAQYDLLKVIYFNRPYRVDTEKNDGIGNMLSPPVSVDNVRSRTKSLIKKGYILQRFSINASPNKMTTCIVNTDKCMAIFGPTPIKNEDQIKLRSNNRITEYTDNRPDNRMTEYPNNRLDNRLNTLISSSSVYNNKTTTTNGGDAIEKILDHPELEFWRGHGTTAKQILNGIQTTGTTLENFIQSMKHYAHEEPKSDKPPMAHMIGGIKRNGIWAKKPDYKSHEEKQAEIQAQIITDRAQELQRLKEIREKTAKIERDLEFEKFMADRDAEIYQEIFQSLTDFEKKRVALGKDEAMRRAWEKKLEL